MSAGCAVAAVTLIIVTAGPAGAHAYVLAAEPAEGALLDTAPPRVYFRFSEAVDLKYASIDVHDVTGHVVHVGALRHESGMRTTLTAALGEVRGGSYSVSWRVVGTDAHVVYGDTSFVVLVPGGAASTAPAVGAAQPVRTPRSEPGLAGLLTLSRALTFLGLAALVGGGAFLTTVWPDGARLRRGRRFVWTGLLVAAGSTVAGAGLEQAAITGQGIGTAVSPGMMVEAINTHFGWIALVRLGLLVLAAVLLVDLAGGVARSTWWRLGAAAVSLGLIRTTVQVGHAAEASGIRSLSYLVHVAAVTIWVGGVLALVAVVLPERRAIEQLRAVLMRFSAVATVALFVVIASGIVLATPVIELWRHVPATDYGRLFVVKLGVIATGVLVASQTRRWTRERSSVVPRRALRAEALLLATVIGVTAILAGRPPMRPSDPSISTGVSVASSAR